MTISEGASSDTILLTDTESVHTGDELEENWDGDTSYDSKVWEGDLIRENRAKFEQYLKFLTPIPGNGTLALCGYFEYCIISKWSNGRMIIYYDDPWKDLVQQCIEAQSGSPLVGCGHRYVVFENSD